jgi:hypothetical protein
MKDIHNKMEKRLIKSIKDYKKENEMENRNDID